MPASKAKTASWLPAPDKADAPKRKVVDIDGDLHAELKHLAERQKVPIREVAEAAIRHSLAQLGDAA